MKITYLILFFMLIVFFVTCRRITPKKIEINEINAFISKYETVDFNEFKGAFIAIRQRNLNSIIYIVQNISKDYPIYIVKYDLLKDTISEIDRTALKKKDTEDYYTQKEISKLICNFRKYNFALLKVDSNNNVFINPWQIGDPAILLRMREESAKETIKIGFVYKKYNNRWYIRN
ncbi:hypothetical protein ACR79S_20280 [Sphingobacterium spiritivorum]|uniref:hypothetical protein n=1 Tax=Sphingobacterium spiritivorum TaxID=258 RepID=UPI003DA5D6E5